LRYLFILQGEGRGHLSQAIALQQMLTENGHQVVGVMTGKKWFGKQPTYLAGKFQQDIVCYSSPSLIKTLNHKGIDIGLTLFLNFIQSVLFIKSIWMIKNSIKHLNPDAVVNFYEPLVGLAYKWHKIKTPHFCFGHHFLTEHHDFPLPGEMPLSRKLLHFMNKNTCFGANKVFALSFRPLAPFQKKNWLVAPPLLRKEVLETKPVEEDFYMGYMLDHGHSKDVLEWHEQNPQVKACFFWDNPKVPKVFEINENLVFHQLDDTKFIHALSHCKGFISTAGFESICEAMYLKKPFVAVPTHNHFEQLCNAHDAHLAGGGIMAKKFNPRVLTKLLNVGEELKLDETRIHDWFLQSTTFYLEQMTNIQQPG
jgi:uncharacterized protein (TIGR00661 family)